MKTLTSESTVGLLLGMTSDINQAVLDVNPKYHWELYMGSAKSPTLAVVKIWRTLGDCEFAVRKVLPLDRVRPLGYGARIFVAHMTKEAAMELKGEIG